MTQASGLQAQAARLLAAAPCPAPREGRDAMLAIAALDAWPRHQAHARKAIDPATLAAANAGIL